MPQHIDAVPINWKRIAYRVQQIKGSAQITCCEIVTPIQQSLNARLPDVGQRIYIFLCDLGHGIGHQPAQGRLRCKNKTGIFAAMSFFSQWRFVPVAQVFDIIRTFTSRTVQAEDERIRFIGMVCDINGPEQAIGHTPVVSFFVNIHPVVHSVSLWINFYTDKDPGLSQPLPLTDRPAREYPRL